MRLRGPIITIASHCLRIARLASLLVDALRGMSGWERDRARKGGEVATRIGRGSKLEEIWG